MRVVVGFLTFLISASLVIAQHHERGSSKTTGPVDLGKIEFPTSGPADAQKHFIEGVLLLHSFEYARSRKAFAEASRIAPDFAMAYWGEAMTYDHPIWGEHDNAAGMLVLSRLAPKIEERRAKAKTDREKMYLTAVEVLFGDSDRQRAVTNYSRAMYEITQRFPDDLEAQAFYALSVLGLTNTVRSTENYMRAAAIAEAVYQKNPLHPGALHYLIHSYDDPVHAPLGLRAARAYGTVARSASHAQHMPSHIFFALGLWEDSIVANTASMKTARDEGVGGYHPLFWLIHAYMQIGRAPDALKLLTTIEEDVQRNPSAPARGHLAMARATILVENRGVGPDTLMQPVNSDGSRSQVIYAGHDLAMGLEHVRRKDLESARAMLVSINKRMSSMGSSSRGESEAVTRYNTATQIDTDTVAVMEKILAAAIESASGEVEAGIRNMLAAAAAEDKLVFEYGPPAIVKPAWEAAGELLLSAGRREEAANAFRNVLKRYPNRRLSNEGLKAAGR